MLKKLIIEIVELHRLSTRMHFVHLLNNEKKTTFFLRINATNINHHNYQFFERDSINENNTILKFANKHEKKIVLKRLMRNKKTYL